MRLRKMLAEHAPLWTIGHSNHRLERFLALLTAARIEAVADVRSVPRSRYVPWFDRDPLDSALRAAGRHYVFLGAELGGRPGAPELYDEDGHVRYGAVAVTPAFAAGLERLTSGMKRMRVAVMCAEEDPAHCHRRLLVARVLHERGHPITHIRRDGMQLEETGFRTETLFGAEEVPWRSSASVLPRRQQSTSSLA